MFQKLKDFFHILMELKVASRSFDYQHYRKTAPDLGSFTDPQLLVHYCVFGWREGRDPSPEFSSSRYLKAYPDVAAAQINPFTHYLSKGRKEGREGQPEIPMDNDLALQASHFDPEYYRANSPDIAHISDQKLLEHFHIAGWKEMRDPTPEFSVTHYLQDHADVAAAKINPFLHYLIKGKDEGRKVTKPLPRAWKYMSADQIEQVEAEFDADFYRHTYGDLGATPRALLQYYVDTGWREGHDPNAEFSTDFYRLTYGDTRGMCPLVHFCLADYPSARRGNADMPQRFIYKDGAQTVPQHFISVLKMDKATLSARPPAKVTPETGLNLHWVIPDFSKGSGGHMTIFRIIRFLELFGHRSTIWIEQPVFHKTANAAYEDIIKFFQCIEAQVKFVDDGFFEVSGDAAIATGWSTSYYVNAATGFAGKYYFVQDHEPEFYPTGAESLLARETYNFDLACICASPWLEQIMQQKYGRWARGFYLAYDHNVYHDRRNDPDFERRLTGQSKRFKIAVYAREHTARRCVQLSLMALELLALKRDDFEVHFFGQEDMSFKQTGFRAHNHGVLDDKTLAQLYNECDLGVCFSSTNYSLVPQEMMACGLPMIELDGDSTRAIFPKEVVSLVGPNPQSICDGIARLMDTPATLKAQAVKATEWTGQFDWENTARTVEKALLGYLIDTGKITSAPAVQPSRELMLDVVIPTYNGMGELEPVIEVLRRQHIAPNMQIHCIDSSSSDGTADWLKQQSDIATTVIDQKDFQHGRTRNVAAAQGHAPFIAYLTQDATPSGIHWGTDIVKMMRHYPEAAGLFGRHLPYPDHCLKVRQEITGHFQNMLNHPLALSRDTDPVRWQNEDRGWRQLLHFYSDNNSAMRRSVWEDIPYPEVDYGEDQVWANMIIEAGYTKLYAPTAVVYHSHDFTPEEAYKRCRIEGAFFYEYFGYELGEGTLDELEGRIAQGQKSLVTWAQKYKVAPEELARQQAILAQKYHGWRDGRIEAQEAAGKAR